MTGPLPPASDGAAGARRTPDGRFATGNGFGRGNPHLRRVHALRARLLEVVDEDAVGRLGRKLLELAEGGDLEAAKVLLAYALGKPPASVALTGPEGEPLGPDWGRLQSTILGALGAFPEARVAVALELRRLADDDADGPTD
jgi:hypothetical protein